MDKIKFSDLSTSLKIFVILGWIMIGFYALAFLIGFTIGIMEV
jgi:hypothetical protein